MGILVDSKSTPTDLRGQRFIRSEDCVIGDSSRRASVMSNSSMRRSLRLRCLLRLRVKTRFYLKRTNTEDLRDWTVIRRGAGPVALISRQSAAHYVKA